MSTANPFNSGKPPKPDVTLGNVKPTVTGVIDYGQYEAQGFQASDNFTGKPVPKITTGQKPEYISTDGRTPVEHYMRGGIECIDVMRAISTPEQFQAYCHLNAFKYLYRLGEKDDPAKEVKKAQDYLMWLHQSLVEAKENRTPAQKISDAIGEMPETD